MGENANLSVLSSLIKALPKVFGMPTRPIVRKGARLSKHRNEKCYCGSGKKIKVCCARNAPRNALITKKLKGVA